jgi:cytochrome c oxidase subunit 3
MSDPADPRHDRDRAGDDPARLAHHFDSPRQQFAAGRLGMWLFLLTEILLFGGMFCAYAVFRANHPEIFFYAERFLDKTLGAVNTGVLITSSFTMASAVYCAQRDRRRGLVVCLALTLALGCGFLGVKAVEYQHKWRDGLLWAGAYDPEKAGHGTERESEGGRPTEDETAEGDASSGGPTAEKTEKNELARSRAGVFFSIYFMMTGLHALHVLAGMAVIAWILVLAARGRFGSRYFAPVDYAGLYWHLVDMIWIYLFPLLYLIH